uniref:NADH dehydrogenase subunit 2 n=1 Tax=Benedenia hoshinai TaxID=407255 RepID=E1U259_BENHO|nr:NADH dehydrogenase subunit 2 [Benedenia hoshinai]ABK58257.1 NADH dehydrogenase subunit 2 [Benedenia hoshinai]
MNFINFISSAFSILFISLCIVSSNFLNLWLFLELYVLSIVPCFFNSYQFLNSYKSLLYYLVVSCISGGLFFIGLLFLNNTGYLFMLFSFLIKFCLFPLGIWLYIVFSNCTWLVIWLIGVVGKIMTPLSFYLFNSDNTNLYLILSLLLILTHIFNSLYFWLGNSNLKLLWCNVSINSGCMIFFIFFNGNSFSWLFLIYYLVWSSYNVLIYYYINLNLNNLLTSFNVLLILLGIPFSLGLLYKILLIICLMQLNISWFLLFSIFFYNIVEQYFIIKFFGYQLSSLVYK